MFDELMKGIRENSAKSVNTLGMRLTGEEHTSVVEALKLNTSVYKIDFSGKFDFTETSFSNLLDLLRINKQIKVVSLGGFMPEGAFELLSEYLRTDTVLGELDLSLTLVGCKVALLLLSALESNNTLHTLILSDCFTSSVNGLAVLAVANSQPGRKLHIYPSFIFGFAGSLHYKLTEPSLQAREGSYGAGSPPLFVAAPEERNVAGESTTPPSNTGSLQR